MCSSQMYAEPAELNTWWTGMMKETVEELAIKLTFEVKTQGVSSPSLVANFGNLDFAFQSFGCKQPLLEKSRWPLEVVILS